MFVMEQPITPAPAADSVANVQVEWNALSLDSCLRNMMEWRGSKGYVDQLEHLSYVLPQDLTVGLILNGLTKDFARFVRSYNMHNMGKMISELHAMLIEYEKESHVAWVLTLSPTLGRWCVLLKAYTLLDKPDMVNKNLCTMVHVFGTNSWREIPQVLFYPISGKAVFTNGCLHWLVSHIDMKSEDGRSEVIWFDVNKDEFRLIKRPNRMCDLWRNYRCYYDQLVDQNGEVGHVCSRTMEVLVLKQKEWVPHCWFEKYIIPDGYIEVLGCWNKDGDMLIKNLADG
nr:hypothetical protein [Tanacetum cinerariifolium]